MPEFVTITEREYKSLQAAAELIRHPEALVCTILANRGHARLVDLEDAFPEEGGYQASPSSEKNASPQTEPLKTKVLRIEQKETSEY